MRPSSVLLLVLAAAWACLHRGALAYICHHPEALSASCLVQISKALGRLLAVGWLFLAAQGLGRLLLKPLALEEAQPAERTLLETAAGLGLFSYLLFALGLLHLWRPWPLAALCAVLSLFIWARPRASWPKGPTWIQALFILPILLAALYGFICANAPPTEWDCLAVHLEIPRQYAKLGALAPLRWLAHGFDPMAIELFSVPALVFKAPELAAMFSLLFLALMASSLWVCGRQLCSRGVALAAVALFLSQPAVTYVNGTPGTDFGVGLFAMLAFWSAWRGVRTGKGDWLILSGALSGLAAVSKTTGVFLGVALAGVLLITLPRRRHFPSWAGAAVLFCAPWLLRNLYYNHNPVWPYLPQLFGGSARDVYLFSRVKAATLEGQGYGWRQLLLLPFNLVFKAESFRHGSQVLVIPFLVLGVYSWRQAARDSFSRWVLAYSGIFTLLWFQAVQNWRYFIPLMPWLCLLACAWAAQAWKEGLLGKALACMLAVGFVSVPALSANNELFVALGLKSQDRSLTSREAYLSHRLDSYPAMADVNKSLPQDAKILLYREVRPFYLERDYLIGDPQNEMLIRYEELQTAEQLYQRLRQLGITQVLVDPALQSFSPLVPAFQRADALMQEVLRRHAGPPLVIHGALIYSWRAP